MALPADGFLILASDGIWDEMENTDAVETVAEYLVADRGGPA